MCIFVLLLMAVLLHCILQAKPYKNNPEILAMTNLVQAYQNDDIAEFEKILRTNRYWYWSSVCAVMCTAHVVVHEHSMFAIITCCLALSSPLL